MRSQRSITVRGRGSLAALQLVGVAAVAFATRLSEPALVFAKPIVLLGEVHDNATQHALRLRALSAWIDRGARPALLMEQFDRSRQAQIDRAMQLAAAGTSQGFSKDADAVIDAGAPGRRGWNWAFYKPFIELALRHGLPIVAVNVGREEARAVIADGLAAHGFDGDVPPAVQAAQAAAVEASHCGLIGADLAGKMAGAQIARDQFMARQIEAHAGRGVVLLAGNGHVRDAIGVPRWLSPGTRAKTETVGFLEAGDDGAAAYDRVVVTPTQVRPDPCDAMRAPR